ncbi:hypothetical protein [Sporosarcina beigongshangi]|uniref:hypothetical protein n=1 Tax=Sporosarcina beigongshangi TaxID=2782538 RepID=UPI00193AAA19|nr:hypothetical protein [Sporosarcina beigongshangi]
MWKLVDGRLIQTTDTARTNFVTNISQSILEDLRLIAKENNTHVNYLIESGLQSLLTENQISYNKDARPKDRMAFNTSCDRELLDEVKQFAKTHRLFLNDVIEYSIRFIDIQEVKKSSHRYRIEL